MNRCISGAVWGGIDLYISSSAVSDVLAAAKALYTGQDDIFTLFFADTDVPDIELLRRELTGAGIRFMGGIAPGLIVGTTVRDCGALIRRFSCAAGPFIVPDFITDDISRDIVQDLEMPFAEGGGTVMIYFPGPNSSTHFLRQIYGLFGNGVTYIGSVMGYEDMVLRPSVFSNEAFSNTAAVFAVLSADCMVAARHGFIPISESMISTATDHNCVREINWRNPLNEYLTVIEEDCQGVFPSKCPEEWIAYHPMLLQTDFPESVCRAVLQITPDGSLVCAGDVPENAVFRVAKYSYESLLNAAAISAKIATGDMENRSAVLFLINCICRKWITGERYFRELETVKAAVSEIPAPVKMEGIFSFGEISSMGTGMLECLNYTCVAGRFYED
ncbi:FIST C-terminal domain-containing protein [Methanogenium sp. S4BF]|uniref:FIST signal transduction protein n=1 Tax=Methanogenium sp. S4BF TaxID=1789226 RepID=UPI00241702E3|nr:FIST C-terminal domain-containing protein [Methanogenium sp. S4BF]WFN34639.1 FIST C-terminal domain-containing protein [Methanogenium sp. S4BF]